MLISHKGHTDTIQVYSVTVMTHVKALQAGHSSQGTSEPITPALMVFRMVVILSVKKLLNLFASSTLELDEGRTTLPFSPMRFLVSLNNFL